MLQTLLAVRTELQSRINYIRERDIFIAPSVYSINTGAKMPCIGIKDGKPTMRELPCCVEEWTLPIHIAIFVRLAKEPALSIVGDVSTSSPGVLAIAADVCDILVGNLLGMTPGMQSALLADEKESEMYMDPAAKGIQRKQITITYTREVEGLCGH